MNPNQQVVSLYGSMAIAMMRQAYSMPNPRNRFWRGMTTRDRFFLLGRAGVLAEYERKEWSEIPPANQVLILKVAKRAARWVEGLGVLQ